MGFFIEGMAGPGSGVWTRFKELVIGLADFRVSVHVLGVRGVHDEAANLPLSSLELIPAVNPIAKFGRRRKLILKFARETGVQVVHIEAPPFPLIANVKTLGTIHDLRHFSGKFTSLYKTEVAYQRLVLPHQRTNVDAWLTLSRWGTDELHRFLKIPSGFVHEIPPIVANFTLNEVTHENFSEGFVLSLGHLEPRKNIQTLIMATFEEDWPLDLELWIAGKDQGSEVELRELAARSKVRIRFLGAVNETLKLRLLRSALLVAIPSLVEGFGIVGVEAPLSGTPVIVSSEGALSDLAVDPRARLHPTSPPAWSFRINEIYRDSALRGQLLEVQVDNAKKFTKGRVIPKLLELYDSLESL